MNHLKLLPYVTVQISNDSTYMGSAVLVKVDNRFYVLTAAHVPFGENCKEYNESLSSNLIYMSELFGKLKFIKELGNIVVFKEHDVFAIEIESNPCFDEFPEVLFISDTDYPALSFLFRGRSKSVSGKNYTIEPCSKNGIYQSDVHFKIPTDSYNDFQGDSGAEVLQGCSGSGIFIQNELSDTAYLTAIVKSVSDDYFNGINATCISIFKKHLIPTIKLVKHECLSITQSTTISGTNLEEVTRSLIAKMLPASLLGHSDLVVSRVSQLKSIKEVPLPEALATRTLLINSIIDSLRRHGTAWVFGAAGVGKTVSAKMAARHLDGNWVGINLRGLSSLEVCQILSGSLSSISGQEITGILIDDLECFFEPSVIDNLLNVQLFCKKNHIYMLFTSSKQADEEYLYTANLPKEIEQKVDDFSEDDINEILSVFGVHEKYWARYIYFVSGGGHPHLAIATIQSMRYNKWDIEEFRSLNSLLKGNEAVERVRSKTRQRLLREFPIETRQLIERVSLITGRFKRNLVLDLAQLEPVIIDGGSIFEQLLGSWIDQHEADRFSLSPLLSNYAATTLTQHKKNDVYYEIADSFVREKLLEPISMNSAFLAAWISGNSNALSYMCVPIFTSNIEDIKIIAPHLIIFSHIKLDGLIYEKSASVNHMLRGAQLILLSCLEDKEADYLIAFNRFEIESESIQEKEGSTLIRTIVYLKLLLHPPKFGVLPNWYLVAKNLDVLFENKSDYSTSALNLKECFTELDDISIIGYCFFNYIHQIKLIDELVPLFEFINSCENSFRDRLLSPLKDEKFDADTLISGAWLSEYDKGTINCEEHTKVLKNLEKLSSNWGYSDISACCIRFSAVIWDETGGQKDQAIALIDEGFEKYGNSNLILIKAKANVLYRAKEYGDSLYLFKLIIDCDDKLSISLRANLYRDAAVCAEHERDYKLAREYFLLGSIVTSDSEEQAIKPMQVGFKADAALASWHDGNKEECIQELANVFIELKDIDPNYSLQAAHCHAACRYILLWLQQESTGKKEFIANGEPVIIYPGIVSNPNPHEDITNQTLVPLEMAWYMLAYVENISLLNIGISTQLQENFSNGPIVEGEFILAGAKLDKAIMISNAELFISALKEIISGITHIQSLSETQKELTGVKFTYSTLSELTPEDLERYMQTVEQFILCFVACCAIQGQWKEIDKLVDFIELDSKINIRSELVNILKSFDYGVTDSITSTARFLMYHKNDLSLKQPKRVFELMLGTLEIFLNYRKSDVIFKMLFSLLKSQWLLIWREQKHLLNNPETHFKKINKAFVVKDYSWPENVIHLMKSILPTLGINNEREVNNMLDDLSRK